MKEHEFKAWLEQGGAQTEAGRNSRTYAVRTIERNLAALGMPYRDLEEAWEADRFETLRERLRKMREDARNGGEDYRILMPDSDNPHNRLSNWGSWLGQYGRFLAGDPPGAAKDADRIRQYVLEHYIEPAREDGRDHVEVLVRDVNKALGLNEAWPNICQALAGRKFRDMAQIPAPERIGADQSSATVFRFDLRGRVINRTALEDLRARFVALCPDFRSFVDPGTGWARGEKAYKVAATERVRSALEEETTDEALGRKVYEILRTAAKDSPLVRWQTEDAIAKKSAELLPEFHATIGRLVRSDDPPERALATAYGALENLRARGATSLTYGERINIVSSALAMARPTEIAPLKVTRINKAWQALTGEDLFTEATADMVKDYLRLAGGFSEMFEIIRDKWNWEPQDWLDIQGFLWISTNESVAASANPTEAPDKGENPEDPMQTSPVNLILYGPPGTGKTFATAAEAVRLCGEQVPEDRKKLKDIYERLVTAGRIAFVTFHQSMSYEEFVEGLRPETRGTEDQDLVAEEPGTSGFRLKVEDGIFKRFSKRAEKDPGEGDRTNRLDRRRRVVRLGLTGGNWREAFDSAIKESRVEWPHGGQCDWSAPEYEDWQAIKDRRQQEDPEVLGNHPSVYGTWLWRAGAETGDYVLLTVGRARIVALGRVSGDYRFQPAQGADPARHLRPVEWLWSDPDGVDRAPIYAADFTSFHPAYTLNEGALNWEALDRLVFGEAVLRNQPPGRPHVLIIDEINRANISKVFGELITLLEPDKRLGQENEIRLTLPYSKRLFGVPANLHIIGTMNTADRSIALLDTALRRRFTFRELMPDGAALKVTARRCGIDLPRLLSTINERIEYLYDREHQIGHAYFINCNSRGDVDQVMRHKVIPLLAEYFFEDWAKIAAVLGDLEPHDGQIKGGFLKRSVLMTPPGLDDGDAAPRFRWEVRSEDEGFDYSRLVGA